MPRWNPSWMYRGAPGYGSAPGGSAAMPSWMQSIFSRSGPDYSAPAATYDPYAAARAALAQHAQNTATRVADYRQQYEAQQAAQAAAAQQQAAQTAAEQQQAAQAAAAQQRAQPVGGGDGGGDSGGGGGGDSGGGGGGEAARGGRIEPHAPPAVAILAQQLAAHRDDLRDLSARHQYAAIDALMRHIAAQHNVTPSQLHDQWVAHYHQTPDDWVRGHPTDRALALTRRHRAALGSTRTAQRP